MEVPFTGVEETRGEAGLMGDGNLRGNRDKNYEFSCGHVEIAELVADQAAGDSVPGWK